MVRVGSFCSNTFRYSSYSSVDHGSVPRVFVSVKDVSFSPEVVEGQNTRSFFDFLLVSTFCEISYVYFSTVTFDIGKTVSDSPEFSDWSYDYSFGFCMVKSFLNSPDICVRIVSQPFSSDFNGNFHFPVFFDLHFSYYENLTSQCDSEEVGGTSLSTIKFSFPSFVFVSVGYTYFSSNSCFVDNGIDFSSHSSRRSVTYTGSIYPVSFSRQTFLREEGRIQFSSVIRGFKFKSRDSVVSEIVADVSSFSRILFDGCKIFVHFATSDVHV